MEADLPLGDGPPARLVLRRRLDSVAAFCRGEALAVFLWSRGAIWLGALLAYFVIRPNRGPFAARTDVPRLTRDLGSVTDIWARWDSIPYLQIAEHGYGGVNGNPAFFPLYPWIVGAAGRVLGDNFVLAGVLVSLAATLVAFGLFHRLAVEKLGPPDAGRALLYLAIFPMALFFQAIYTESLFLCLVLAAFMLAERQQWLATGIAAGLAFLTGPTGFALLPSLFLLAWRARHRGRAFAGVLLAPIVFLAFPLVLHFQVGNPWGFVHDERLWHRRLSPYGPLEGIWRALHAAWAGVLQLTVGSARHYYWTPVDPARAAALNLEYLVYAVLFLFLAWVAWRELGAVYGLFGACCLAIPLSAPSNAYPLLSMPRLGLTIFPLFFALAVVGRRPRAHTAIVVLSAILLGVSTVEWATWQWVS
jgi:Dolichyl-phosphate-mannose-protein mannosyltransferase